MQFEWFSASCLLLVTTIITNVASEKCITPNNETARCISIHQCTILLDAIKSRDKSLVPFLQASQCGPGGSAVFLCCGSYANYTRPDEPVKLNKVLFPSRSFCGYQHSDDRFNVQNRTAEIDEFPWLVILMFEDKGVTKRLCSGALINNRYVLTAAHCVAPQSTKYKLSSVRIGEYNVSAQVDCVDSPFGIDCIDSALDVGIEEAIKHPNFTNTNYENDIGLLRLNTTIKFTDYVRPICLPIPGSHIPTIGDTMVVSGWGVTEAGVVSQIKKKVVNYLISNEDCQNYYKNRISVTARHLCLNETNSGDINCAGDSGGPVMFSYRNQWQMEAVNSFGPKTCGAGMVSGHTKVSEYIEWLRINMYV